MNRTASACVNQGMTRRRATALASLTLFAAACGQSAPDRIHRGGPVLTVLSGTARHVALTPSLSPRALANTQRAFGADLLKAVCSAQKTGNVTVSPASAALALGQLDAGARGATRAKLDVLLHLPGWSDTVLAAYQAQRVELARLTQLRVSNHVYSAQGNPPTQETLDDLATGFGSKLAQLDFSTPAATDAINADVSTDTKGLIPKLFDTPLSPSTVTVLTNALHLKADWVTPFDTTTDSPFVTDAGKTVTAPMMSSPELAGAYRSTGGWESAELPYAGGQLTAYAILPPKRSRCSEVTGTDLTALTTGPSLGTTGLQMPSVDLAQTHDLDEPLKALGLPMNGDFSGLGPQTDSVSTMIQKVVLKVDKKGTEGAAATGTVMSGSAMMPPHRELVLDRPYLLVIQDTKTGTPLFLSRVGDPTGPPT